MYVTADCRKIETPRERQKLGSAPYVMPALTSVSLVHVEKHG
jgi:hypothetical protein